MPIYNLKADLDRNSAKSIQTNLRDAIFADLVKINSEFSLENY
jgi:hypothetical protein